MFEQFTYKKKFYGLLILAVLLAFTAYKRSFKGAFQAISYYSESKRSIDKSGAIGMELQSLQNETLSLDAVIGKTGNDSGIVQNKILEFLANEGDDIIVSEIQPPHFSEDEYFTVHSNLITLKGTYGDISEVLYDFEKKFDYARIVNFRFYTKRNPRTGKNELYNDIIFQNYEKKN